MSPSAPRLLGFLEAVSRRSARGWALDPAAPQRRVVMEAVADGAVLGRAPADLFRGDVADAGLGDGGCGFRIDLSAHAGWLGGRMVTVRDAATGAVLQGGPAPATDPPSLGRFLQRWQGVPPRVQQRLARMMRHRTRGGVSVVLTDAALAGAVLPGLRAQLCDRWELVVPHAGTIPTALAGLATGEPRLRPVAGGVGAGLAAARHGVAVVVTAPARFEADAVYHLLRAAAATRAGLLLWDVAWREPGGGEALLCRPAFSIEHYLSRPELGSAFAVRVAALQAAGGWGMGEVDAVLRLVARGALVAHIPRVLHRQPAAPTPPEGTFAVVRRHLANCGAAATALPEGGIRVDWPAAQGRSLVVIPSRNQAALLERCLESLLRTRAEAALSIVVIDHESDQPDARALLARYAGLVTVMPYRGPFHFARMNNLAVARHGEGAETLLFLNNDTEAVAAGWLGRMQSLAVRPEVGAVGALLLYGDGRVQHAGAFLGFDGSAAHAHTLVPAFRADGGRNPGPGGQLTALREVSAVTGACMMLRREVFAAVGGFDEQLAIGFNDTDLCLRLRARGYRILQDGQSVLYHHESRSRRLSGQVLHATDTALFKARWSGVIAAGDPFYHPNLRLDVEDHALRPDCLPGGPPRVSARGASDRGTGAAPAAAATAGSAAPRRRRSSG